MKYLVILIATLTLVATQRIIYWGKGSDKQAKRLLDICVSGVFDAVALDFGWQHLEMARLVKEGCSKKPNSVYECKRLGEDISACQKYGIEILMVIRQESDIFWVGPNATDTLESYSKKIHDAYGRRPPKGAPRPFRGASVDGYIYHPLGTGTDRFSSLPSELRKLDQKSIIAADVDCVAYLGGAGESLDNNKFDLIFVLFEGKFCNLNERVSWEYWESLAEKSSSPRMKLIPKIPASTEAAGMVNFASPSVAKENLRHIESELNFGGIAFHDDFATYDGRNLDDTIEYAKLWGRMFHSSLMLPGLPALSVTPLAATRSVYSQRASASSRTLSGVASTSTPFNFEGKLRMPSRIVEVPHFTSYPKAGGDDVLVKLVDELDDTPKLPIIPAIYDNGMLIKSSDQFDGEELIHTPYLTNYENDFLLNSIDRSFGGFGPDSYLPASDSDLLMGEEKLGSHNLVWEEGSRVYGGDWDQASNVISEISIVRLDNHNLMKNNLARPQSSAALPLQASRENNKLLDINPDPAESGTGVDPKKYLELYSTFLGELTSNIHNGSVTETAKGSNMSKSADSVKEALKRAESGSEKLKLPASILLPDAGETPTMALNSFQMSTVPRQGVDDDDDPHRPHSAYQGLENKVSISVEHRQMKDPGIEGSQANAKTYISKDIHRSVDSDSGMRPNGLEFATKEVPSNSKSSPSSSVKNDSSSAAYQAVSSFYDNFASLFSSASATSFASTFAFSSASNSAFSFASNSVSSSSSNFVSSVASNSASSSSSSSNFVFSVASNSVSSSSSSLSSNFVSSSASNSVSSLASTSVPASEHILSPGPLAAYAPPLKFTPMLLSTKLSTADLSPVISSDITSSQGIYSSLFITSSAHGGSLQAEFETDFTSGTGIESKFSLESSSLLIAPSEPAPSRMAGTTEISLRESFTPDSSIQTTYERIIGETQLKTITIHGHLEISSPETASATPGLEIYSKNGQRGVTAVEHTAIPVLTKASVPRFLPHSELSTPDEVLAALSHHDNNRGDAVLEAPPLPASTHGEIEKTRDSLGPNHTRLIDSILESGPTILSSSGGSHPDYKTVSISGIQNIPEMAGFSFVMTPGPTWNLGQIDGDSRGPQAFPQGRVVLNEKQSSLLPRQNDHRPHSWIPTLPFRAHLNAPMPLSLIIPGLWHSSNSSVLDSGSAVKKQSLGALVLSLTCFLHQLVAV